MINLIENNSYRILGLDITANQKDILKRYKEIINRLKIDDYPEYDLDIKLPKKFRSEFTVTDALKSLQSQKSNIKEYFFWFQINDKIDEKALKFMQNEDFANATLTWKNASKIANTTSYFYKKNLALLYCLLLSEENNSNYLKDSLNLWHEILNSDKFWEGFLKLYTSNNEQVTNSGIFSDFKKNVVKYISDIYTELHKKYKDNNYVKDFQEIFGIHGERTEKSILQPIYQSIYEHIEEIQKINIDEDKKPNEKDIKNINKIVDLVQQDMNKLKEMGAYNNDSSKAVRDRAAEVIRNISIALHNHANEFEESSKLLKIAINVCGTESLRKIFTSEVKKIDKNPYIHCWFCNSILKKSDEENSLNEPWHRITGTEKNFWGNTERIQFQQFELIVPRCERCMKAHNKYKLITGIDMAVAAILGISLIVLLSKIWEGLSLIIGSLIGISTYFILKGIGIGGLKEVEDITKPESYRKEFPTIKELLKNGWKKGEEPST